MAIWVCRTGANGQFAKVFFENNAIYLTRDGLYFNIAEASKEDVINRLNELQPGAAKQTIGNVWSQVDMFARRMNIGDIVLIPQKSTPQISVGKITSEYRYACNKGFPFQHERTVSFIHHAINTTTFPHDIRCTLGAFRTIFSINQEERMIDIFKELGLKV